MLDPKRLRTDAAAIAAQLARRGYVFDLDRFNALEARRKQLQTETENLQAERNSGSKRIGQAKAKGEDVAPILADMDRIKTQLASNETALTALQTEFEELTSGLPNVPHASVPDGKSEDDNVEIRRWGKPRASEGAKDHADLGEAIGLMDFAAAAKLTGARFTVLRGGLARLHRALGQFMLDTHVNEHGYEELYVPFIVNAASFRGTGQMPKFGDDLFWLSNVPGDGAQWGLIPTAEVPVTNLLRDEILDAANLPKKWVAHTPCFRA